MILQSLYQLHERLKDDPDYEVAPPGYSLQKITFKVMIRPDGSLFDIEDARIGDKKNPRLIRVLGSAKPSGSGLNPCFLWDNTGYMLGFKPDDPKPERSVKAFEAFRERHLRVEQELDSPTYAAVCRFLESWSPQRAVGFPILSEIKSGFGVFQIVGETQFVHQSEAIDLWWKDQLNQDGEQGPEGQCLLTGKWGPIARLQPMVKGVAGGNAQASLVGFNDTAYWSYGKEQSFNAPVNVDAAEAYGAALNSLLDGPMRMKHRMTLGDATLVFWTDRPSLAEDVFAQFAREGDDAINKAPDEQDEGVLHKLEIFVNALREGVEKYGDIDNDPDRTHFYILGLSPNQGRLAVRFFLNGSLRELLDNLRRHYHDLKIERQYDAQSKRPDPEFPPTWMLLRQTGREAKDIPPILGGPLLRAIVMGMRYPQAMMSAVIRRIHADHDINYIRASIIKGCLTRNHKQEMSMSLDPERTDAAYRLGRLFAALEKVQQDALGQSLNATIRDRYYSSASATPRTVFPRLLRTYQHHLAKIDVNWKVSRERLVQEILAPIDDFPPHFDLAAQGRFALGYYHQRQDFYKKKEKVSDDA